MVKPGIQSSEGQTSIGIIVAGCYFIYYILSSRNPEAPSIDLILANAENAIDIAKAYAETSPELGTSNNIFDGSAIIALLFSMYKTYSKYTDGRVNLKKEEAVLSNTVQTDPRVTNIPAEDLKKF